MIPNELSRAGSLVHFVEEDLEATDVGICLDFGHAHMDGDLLDAIETVSGHLITTHVHDNRGRADDHLVPFRRHHRLARRDDGRPEGRLRPDAAVRNRRARIAEGHAGESTKGAAAARAPALRTEHATTKTHGRRQ